MKTVFLLLTAIVLSGCYEENKTKTTYQFNWAVVDKKDIENEVFKRATIKNPYPEEISADQTILTKERKEVSRQINNIRSRLKRACAVKQNGEKKVPSKRSGSPSSGEPLEPAVYRLGRNNKFYDDDCIRKIESDPLLDDLESKKEKLDGIYAKQQSHYKTVRKFSKRYSQELIDDYAKSKFELVLDDNGKDILYNTSGLVLNITDALISQIDDNQLIMPAEM